jgi:manganese/iron transport system substrate-binding protein
VEEKMLTRTKYLASFTIFTLFLLLAAQCGPSSANAPAAEEKAATVAVQADKNQHQMAATDLAPVPLAKGEKLKVVATTSIVADIVKNIGGDLIDLSLLLPVGTDPHSFQPTPRDLATVADAYVIFANGMGLEAFLDEMIRNAGGGAAVVYVSDGIEPRQMNQAEAPTHEAEEEEHAGEHEAEGHLHEGADPHTWTAPNNAVIFVQNIELALSTLDPANSTTYQTNAQAYQTQLRELDQWVKTQIDTIPAENRKLVTDHAVFGYYADRYGLQQVGAVIPSFSTAAEPSAQELADLENAIRTYGVRAIFVGTTVNSTLSQRVADDTGIKLLRLYTGSLGPAGSGVETYLDYIRYNTTTIVEGLR